MLALLLALLVALPWQDPDTPVINTCGTIVAAPCGPEFLTDWGDLLPFAVDPGLAIGARGRISGTPTMVTDCAGAVRRGVSSVMFWYPNGCNLAQFCDCATGNGAPCGNAFDPWNGMDDETRGGCANSTGGGAFLRANGSPSVSSDALFLTTGGLPGHSTLFLVQGTPGPRLPFRDGLRCVTSGSAALYRYPALVTGQTVGTGYPDFFAYNAATLPPGGQLQPGSTYAFQVAYRDPQGPCGTGFNMTSGALVTVEP